jgi:Na+/proline symporter
MMRPLLAYSAVAVHAMSFVALQNKVHTSMDVTQIRVAPLDLAIIVIYLVGILLAGLYLTRLASRGIDSYFLGGRQLPWWLLGLSGTASYFDVTGVMWTIAFFYIMGQRFMWLQWEWGFLAMAFFAGYMGKWLRRSSVLTGAEWMVIRFGRGPAGEFARTSYAVLAVTVAIAFIGFAEYGCGLFLAKFIPASSGVGSFLDKLPFGVSLEHKLAILMMGATAIYTLAAGLYGVVLTSFIQFCIILFGSGVLIFKALTLSSYEKVAAEVPPEWFGFGPIWKWEHLKQWELTEPFYFLTLMMLVWVAKGLFLSVGGPQQLYDMQRFLSARSPREASKAGLIWGIGMTPMFMVSAAVGVIGLVTWGGNIEDPENLYPVVIGTMLPIGVKGLVLAGLLSAFMSTFSATVNAGASYLLRDGYQAFIRPKASSKELVYASRLCSLVVILAGIWAGMQAKNIDTLFGWIMIILGTAVLMPNVLRWFWWRFNGMGFAVGTLIGVAASLMVAIWFEDVPIYKTFFVLFAISTVSSIIASLLSPPTEMYTLKEFYLRVRPAGLWGPVKQALAAEGKLDRIAGSNFRMDLLTAIIGGVGLQALFLMSAYACTHQWTALTYAAGVVVLTSIILYFTWYKHLPAKDEMPAATSVADD